MNTPSSRTTRYIVRAAVIAAIYAALTLALQPISYGAVQLRFSEAASWCGNLVSEATLQASFPARDDPLVLYGRPSPGRRPFPRRLPGVHRLRLPRVCLRPLAAAGSDRITERTPRLFFTCSLGHPFLLVTSPARVIPS